MAEVGSYAILSRRIENGKYGLQGGKFESAMEKWRTRHDSNVWPSPSEGKRQPTLLSTAGRN